MDGVIYSKSTRYYFGMRRDNTCSSRLYRPVPSYPDVLRLEVGIHRCRRQLRSTLPTYHCLALLHMERVSLDGHPPPIGRGGFFSGDGPRLTYHRHRLSHVSSESNSLKDTDYYVKVPLHPHQIGGGNEDVI